MKEMFRECKNLRKIYVGDNWKTATENTNMFKDCKVEDVTVK